MTHSISTGFDVVILGAGAAGIAAARSAYAAGASRIAVVSAGAGATDFTAGWIASATDVNVNTDIDVFPQALAWLAEIGLRTPGHYTFATPTGTTVQAVSGLRSLCNLSELGDGPLGIVDLVAGAAWSAELVAATLRETLGRECKVIAAHADAPCGSSPGDLARTLDSQGITDALGEALRSATHGCVALLCPPVLGLLRDDVAEQLATRTGIPVGETGGAQGDPPAVRLGRAFGQALPNQIEQIRGRATVDPTPEGGARVTVAGRELRTHAVVLATGGLASGGLRFDGAWVEPCAGAPVWLARENAGEGNEFALQMLPTAERGPDPLPLFSPDVHGRVLGLTAGVRVTSDGHVAGHDGVTPLWPWLFAAGAVVTGQREIYGPPLAQVLADGYATGLRAAGHAAELGRCRRV